MDSKHGVFVNRRKITERTQLAEDDEILIGRTTLLFTEEDFDDQESALMHYKKFGEKMRPTRME